MDFVCLAAGQGTRFGRLGSYLQKCMYPVGLRPFLEYSVRNLRRLPGIDPERDRLLLVVGHHGEQVRRYFGSDYDGLPVLYAEQPEPLGTGHALRLAGERLEPREPVVAWLADLYVSTDLFAQIARCPLPNAQTLAPGPPGEKPELRASWEGDRVTRAWQGEGDEYDIGLWRLEPDVLRGLAERREGEYRVLPHLQRFLEAGREIAALHADEWVHLGGVLPSPEANALAVARRVLEREGVL